MCSLLRCITSFLQVWSESGVKDTNALKKLLVGRSLKTAGVVLFQILLDAGAAWGGFYTGGQLQIAPDFFGRIPIEFLAYFVGCYFSLGVIFDLFSLGLVTGAAAQFAGNT